jgi:predicted amidohydrolase
MKPFKLAMIQMSVVGGEVARNLTRAGELIGEAASAGARVALLPECLDVGWTHSDSRKLATPVPSGRTFRSLAASAADNGIFVCAGLSERSGDHVYNSSVLIDPKGELLALHRKLNELDIGHDCYNQGDRLGVVQTELGTIGMMICADAFAKDEAISRSLGYMGADIILSPCAWAVPHDHDNVGTPYGAEWKTVYGPVAREFAMTIAGVSNVGEITSGPWCGRRCIGCSLAVGPTGNVLTMGPYGVGAETILYLDVQPIDRPARGSAWAARWAPKA